MPFGRFPQENALLTTIRKFTVFPKMPSTNLNYKHLQVDHDVDTLAPPYAATAYKATKYVATSGIERCD
jgi:hypothetical protein